MKIKHYMAALAVFLTANVAFGQRQNNNITTGYLFSQATFNHTDIIKLSQFNHSFGTARSTAMGGAFASLGADLSSMGINPAGLGMYMTNEVSITPSLSFSKFDNRNSEIWGSQNSKTNFGINNFGIALNLHQGSGALTSFTFGFGYNKLADFNYKNQVYPPNVKTTIGDVFVQQLNSYRGSNINFDRMSPSHWGAVLGYWTYFVDPVVDSDNNTEYILNTVGNEVDIEHMARTSTRGSIGEYSISGGFNFQNKFYFGIAVGIQDIYMKQKIYYDEAFIDNSNAVIPASYIVYDQFKKLSGSGVNFKIGAIYRPIPSLRIGLAVHTPTFSTVTMDYDAHFDIGFINPSDKPDDYLYGADSPTNIFDYDYQTPTRLLAGVSYTILDRAILAVDYERTWYNRSRIRGDDSYTYGINPEISRMFKASNTVRAGLEVRPLPHIAFRAGYAYSSSLAEDDYRLAPSTQYDSPVAHTYYNVSGGLGAVLGRFNLDLTYVYTHTKYTGYTLYSSHNANTGIGDYTGTITPSMASNNIMFTVGYRF